MHASYRCCGEDVGRNHTKECYESRGLAAEEERVQLHNNFSSRKDRRAAQRAQEKVLKRENEALRLENARLRAQQAKGE